MAKIIELTKGYSAIIDDEDFELVSQCSWQITETHNNVFYAQGSVGKKCTKMHRLIMGVTDKNVFVDHIDRNGLNNQRSNLRIATRSENMCNRKSQKEHKGVCYCRVVKRYKDSVYIRYFWEAHLQKDKIKYKKTFSNKEDAIAYRKQLSEKLHGDFARL